MASTLDSGTTQNMDTTGYQTCPSVFGGHSQFGTDTEVANHLARSKGTDNGYEFIQMETTQIDKKTQTQNSEDRNSKETAVAPSKESTKMVSEYDVICEGGPTVEVPVVFELYAKNRLRQDEKIFATILGAIGLLVALGLILTIFVVCYLLTDCFGDCKGMVDKENVYD